ncbi:hypothetical protein [Bradyrhizobium sp. JYMT SZCCT0428]|uniref:hypothetical protein n=1 Tax=Bradyrhizobium sp. JYMT SZCCT0428 TaxID=2807673 RepID=UPI001BAD47D6|nr:hypothetical protein [Bradyrhizobium sp. JYMT SZCCT0428]MBR1150081.1 hypothetical protein [Bradyrhizobium sp. JYMT SZCCT0428]
MSDKREAVMVRLLAIAKDIEDVESAERNAPLADDVDARRISLLEGAEEVNEEFGSRHAADKGIVVMIPQLLIACSARTRDVGADLNMIRGRLIKAVMTDTELLALTVNKRSIRYAGMDSDLAFAMLMEGRMAIRFRIAVMLDPKAL